MGDELFLRSRCSGGAGCHCAGMEHFYVPDSTGRDAAVSTRTRRTSNMGGENYKDINYSPGGAAKTAVPRVARRPAGACDPVGGVSAGSRRVSGTPGRRQGSAASPAAAGDASFNEYLAYSTDEEFDEFIKKPRTDYTYSRSLSYTAVSPERVGPPSMSRYGLHAAGDSPVLGRTLAGPRVTADREGSPQLRETGGRSGRTAESDSTKQSIYEIITTKVYSYRQEITSRVFSSGVPSDEPGPPSPTAAGRQQLEREDGADSRLPPAPSQEPGPAGGAAPPSPVLADGGEQSSQSSPPSSQSSPPSSQPSPPSSVLQFRSVPIDPAGYLFGISPGLDMDSADEEWVPMDGVAKTSTARRHLPFTRKLGGTVRRGTLLLLSPLLLLWTLLSTVSQYLLSVVRRTGALLCSAAGRAALLVSPFQRGDEPHVSVSTRDPVRAPTEASLRAPAAAQAAAQLRAPHGQPRDQPDGSVQWGAGAPVEAALPSRPSSAGSRLSRRSGHRYGLRSRRTPEGAAPSAGLADTPSSASFQSADSREPAARLADAAGDAAERRSRVISALGWITAVIVFLNPLRWLAALARAALSPLRAKAEVPGPPRGAATVAAAARRSQWLEAAGSGPSRWSSDGASRSSNQRDGAGRPGWLRSVGLMLWGPSAAAADHTDSSQVSISAEPGSSEVLTQEAVAASSGHEAGAGAARITRSHGGLTGEEAVLGSGGSPKVRLNKKTTPARAWGEAEEGKGADWRGWLLPLLAALLLLLLLLLLLPLIGNRRREDTVQSSEDWWLPLEVELLAQKTEEGLSSVKGGLVSLGSSAVAATQVTWAWLVSPSLWSSPAARPAPSTAVPGPPQPEPEPAPDASRLDAEQLDVVFAQLKTMAAAVDTLQAEYKRCRAAAAAAARPDAVRAALGLPPTSTPVPAAALAAAERRLAARLDAELRQLRARLGEEPGAELRQRLAALEAELPAAEERLETRSAAAAARAEEMEEEVAALRRDVEHLHQTLRTVQEGLRRAGSCCNGTSHDWGSRLRQKLHDLELHLDDRVRIVTDSLRQDVSAELLLSAAGAGAGGGGDGVSRQEALSIAQREVALYDADKTGKFDFALESAGGSIVSTKCTEPYSLGTAQLTLLGIPLWYPRNNPRSIIQPTTRPGECFAFRGEGRFVVSLSRPVVPAEFVVEHIARGLTPDNRIDSAPRDCTVTGLGDDPAAAPVRLATFTYSEAGPPLQRFPAAAAGRAFSAVELTVTSNWGHPEYTCLYRFRVHGEGAPPPPGDDDEVGV